MAVFSEILQTMTGAVISVKKNARAQDCRRFINDRIRRLIDRRIFWADLLARGVINIPAAYITGTIATTTSSQTITGTATAWPVSDVSNTTVVAAITDFGYQEITPVSMVGIVTDSLLYIDAGTAPEVVAVISTTPTTFTASFQKSHLANFTVTQSSLAGLQFKTGGNYPTYNVNAIVSNTSALLDLPWAGTGLTGSSYQILKMFYTIDPAFKDFLAVWDPTRSQPIGFHVPLSQLTYWDPQRTTTGSPQCFVDHSPTAGGTMMYELWPNQTTAYQLQIVYTKQWPELINPTDRPPSFINPSVIIDGATADALRVNNGVPPDYKDPLQNPALAREYEAKWELGVQYCMNADESKALQAYESYMASFGIPGGLNYAQTHAVDAFEPWF